MPILEQRTWLYKGQTGRIFPEGVEVPEGWGFAPEVPYAAEGEYPEVIELYHTPKIAKPLSVNDAEIEVLGFGGGLRNSAPLTVAEQAEALTASVKRGPGRPPNPRPVED